MHERHARYLALAIGIAVVAAAFAFASRGPAPSTRVAAPANGPATIAPSAATARGAALFIELGCDRCHAFRGVGDAAGALDDAASRADRRELERWITAAPEVAEALPPNARRAKARYRALPREDLDALVDYLARDGARIE